MFPHGKGTSGLGDQGEAELGPGCVSLAHVPRTVHPHVSHLLAPSRPTPRRKEKFGLGARKKTWAKLNRPVLRGNFTQALCDVAERSDASDYKTACTSMWVLCARVRACTCQVRTCAW